MKLPNGERSRSAARNNPALLIVDSDQKDQAPKYNATLQLPRPTRYTASGSVSTSSIHSFHTPYTVSPLDLSSNNHPTQPSTRDPRTVAVLHSPSDPTEETSVILQRRTLAQSSHKPFSARRRGVQPVSDVSTKTSQFPFDVDHRNETLSAYAESNVTLHGIYSNIAQNFKSKVEKHVENNASFAAEAESTTLAHSPVIPLNHSSIDEQRQNRTQEETLLTETLPIAGHNEKLFHAPNNIDQSSSSHFIGTTPNGSLTRSFVQFTTADDKLIRSTPNVTNDVLSQYPRPTEPAVTRSTSRVDGTYVTTDVELHASVPDVLSKIDSGDEVNLRNSQSLHKQNNSFESVTLPINDLNSSLVPSRFLSENPNSPSAITGHYYHNTKSYLSSIPADTTNDVPQTTVPSDLFLSVSSGSKVTSDNDVLRHTDTITSDLTNYSLAVHNNKSLTTWLSNVSNSNSNRHFFRTTMTQPIGSTVSILPHGVTRAVNTKRNPGAYKAYSTNVFTNSFEVTTSHINYVFLPSPIKSSVTDPMDSNETDPTDSTVTNPIDLSVTDQINSNETNPVDSAVTNPIDISVTDPIDSNETDPTDSTVTNPIDLSVTNPINGNETDPVDRTMTNPIEISITDLIDSPVTDKSNGLVTDLIINLVTDDLYINPVTDLIVNPLIDPHTVTDPGDGPVTVPTSYSETDSIVNPVTDSIINPVTDSILNPVTDSIMNPVTDLIINPVTDSIINPVTDSIINPVIDSIINPVIDSIINPVTESIINPVTDLIFYSVTDQIIISSDPTLPNIVDASYTSVNPTSLGSQNNVTLYQKTEQEFTTQQDVELHPSKHSIEPRNHTKKISPFLSWSTQRPIISNTTFEEPAAETSTKSHGTIGSNRENLSGLEFEGGAMITTSVYFSTTEPGQLINMTDFDENYAFPQFTSQDPSQSASFENSSELSLSHYGHLNNLDDVGLPHSNAEVLVGHGNGSSAAGDAAQFWGAGAILIICCSLFLVLLLVLLIIFIYRRNSVSRKVYVTPSKRIPMSQMNDFDKNPSFIPFELAFSNEGNHEMKGMGMGKSYITKPMPPAILPHEMQGQASRVPTPQALHAFDNCYAYDGPQQDSSSKIGQQRHSSHLSALQSAGSKHKPRDIDSASHRGSWKKAQSPPTLSSCCDGRLSPYGSPHLVLPTPPYSRKGSVTTTLSSDHGGSSCNLDGASDDHDLQGSGCSASSTNQLHVQVEVHVDSDSSNGDSRLAVGGVEVTGSGLLPLETVTVDRLGGDYSSQVQRQSINLQFAGDANSVVNAHGRLLNKGTELSVLKPSQGRSKGHVQFGNMSEGRRNHKTAGRIKFETCDGSASSLKTRCLQLNTGPRSLLVYSSTGEETTLVSPSALLPRVAPPPYTTSDA